MKNRLALILELIALGLTPPPNIPNDALFDCVDAARRKKAGETGGDMLAHGFDAIVIHHPEGPMKMTGKVTDRKSPEEDTWPEGRALARAFATLA